MLLVCDERCVDHDPGPDHPERPDRLRAALGGVASIDPELIESATTPREATTEELRLVHAAEHIAYIEAVSAAGGGRLEPSTVMNSASLPAALLAAGSVLTAIERLEAGAADSAFCVVRPPGHHATADTAMGFCLFNSVAVAAAHLVTRGQRVAIVDVDAHHGNGTQDIFAASGDVFFASIHQSPLYPGTGGLTERGHGAGEGTTVNVPLPPGATGDVALAALDEVIVPALERFSPDWLLVSAGFDGHRDDPITNLGYTSTDFGAMLRRLLPIPAVETPVIVLEGGYDLDAVAASAAVVTSVLLGGDHRVEPSSNGGPGREMVAAAAALHDPDRAPDDR